MFLGDPFGDPNQKFAEEPKFRQLDGFVLQFLIDNSAPQQGGSFTQNTNDFTLSSNNLVINSGNLSLDGVSSSVLSALETITMSNSSQVQTLSLPSASATPALTTITGTGDDQVTVFGDRDFSGVTFTNIDSISLSSGSGSRQTMAASSSTSFGNTLITLFTSGNDSTTDVFDYTSALIGGDGTSISAGTGNANQLGETRISSANSTSEKVNAIAADNKGVVVFENSDIGLNLGTASESTILSTVEALLEDTSANALTGADAQVTKGGLTTDALLVFGAQTGGGTGSVIIRYNENADGDSDDPFDDELSLAAVFFGALNLTDANIV